MSQFLQTLKRASDFIDTSRAPLETDGAHTKPSLLSKSINDLITLAERGSPYSIEDVAPVIDAIKHANTVGLDDRKLLQEKLLVMMSRAPDDSIFAQKLEEFTIDLFYKDLPHPPAGYLSMPSGNDTQSLVGQARGTKYAYRSADGSHYNPAFPSIGKAGSPYARTVPSKVCTPLNDLPDPGMVFDTLLKRDKFVKHPGGISSLFFAFADLIIHSVFNTSHQDYTVNSVSSYLDLSPLYGSSQQDVDKVRDKDGKGRIWDDVFADARIRTMPPSVCALLILFARNHNFIAAKILHINERKSFKRPDELNDEQRLEQDDEIFQRARLVNCGFFMQVILGDYVGAILGLVRDGLPWRLNPLEATRELTHEVSPLGEGNVCSIEFNLMYRWHAAVSAADTAWTEAEFHQMFPGKQFDSITTQDFKDAFADVKSPAHALFIPDPDVRKWEFGGLKRDENGRFKDAELAEILLKATETYAGAFKARGCPEVLRVVEMLGIEQSREWGTCSMNEFRRFMGLKPFDSFKEWNPDPEIHTAAAALYHDIDNLELHVGLQAEQTKLPGPGAGLCPGYTISRAILSDAVCLTRGDRFLTVDFTPFNLTAWGYQDCQYDKADGSYGGLLTKLLFRILPDYYPSGNAYAHFPFLVPEAVEKAFKDRDDPNAKDYTWKRPPPPTPTLATAADTVEDVETVLTAWQTFESQSVEKLKVIAPSEEWERKLVRQVVFAESELRIWKDWFRETTAQLVKENSVKRFGSNITYVDIVNDVINLLPVRWLASEVMGLSLKSRHNQSGIILEHDLYRQVSDVCNYVLLNDEPALDWGLRERSQATAKELTEFVKLGLAKASQGLLSVSAWASFALQLITENVEHSQTIFKRLLEVGIDSTHERLAAALFAEVVPTAAHFSQAITHVVNFYLDDAQATAREEIIAISKRQSSTAARELMPYIYEALRLDPPIWGVYRKVKRNCTLSSLQIPAGDRVFVDIRKASLDPQRFGPDPLLPSYEPPRQPGIWSAGEQGLLSTSFFEATAPEVIREIFRLPNLRRAPNDSGRLNRFLEEWKGKTRQMYINAQGGVTPFPATMLLQRTV